MVMEKPSAHNVAREFVRQYYTLLHQAPQYLHRFYSANSSFLHGGMEKAGQEQPAICGQEQIHQRIMDLKFTNCRAKIFLVDSQASVGNGIVVQVSGELSNDNGPMRRFMQTFVLVEQEPRKYYVHNDIFRYQDEVFENDGQESNEIHSVEAVEEAGDVQEEGYYAENVPDGVEVQAAPMSNGSAHLEEEEEHKEEEKTEPEPVEVETTPEPQQTEEKTSQPESAAKPTWADMAGKNTIVKTATPAATTTVPPKTEPKPVEQPQRAPRRERGRPSLSQSERETSRSGGVESDSEVRSTRRFQDSHQVFVGNLAHDTTEDELREYFTRYGSVEEVRIIQNNKKTKDEQEAPNYGFIVFKEVGSVAAVLNKRGQLTIRGDRRLNVEEKKPRDGAKVPSGSMGRSGLNRPGAAPRGMSGPGAGRRGMPTRPGGDKGNFSSRGGSFARRN
ncbi:DgyrCDS5692 [Dimorphilus gyrociliatus]|uniref:DgyrCDS5692 n=1 Tax=Dimorphilus gyrociliatus TaxID=2664684 RepID=A0A7I8VKR2_9ANNE|nr:DgyrCDS5692 [Dimorphilus gyrociliatus]